jgi:hypothetical protein
MADEFDPYYQWLGIPPKFQPPSHYRLLALEDFEGNLDVIENAADRQIAHVRLFQNGPNGEVSQRVLNEITAAKLCLLNAEKKREYDARLRSELNAASAAAGPPQPRPVRTERPMPRAESAEPAPTPAEPSPHSSPQVVAPSSGRSSLSRGRRKPLGQQLLIPGIIGVLIVGAAVVYVTQKRNGKPTSAGNGSGQPPIKTTPVPIDLSKKASSVKPSTTKPDVTKPEPTKIEPKSVEPKTGPRSPAPALLAPEPGATLPNGILDGDPTYEWNFAWDESPGATKYHLHVKHADAKIPAVDIDRLTATTYRLERKGYIPSKFLSNWKWKVRAEINGAWTDWSEERSFEVSAARERPSTGPEPGHTVVKGRARPPSPPELEKARQQVQATFKTEFEQAQTPQGKMALAQSLLKQAANDKDPAGVKFASLEAARDLAIQAAEVELALKINEQMASAFEVDAAAVKRETFARLSAANMPNDRRKALVTAILEAAEDAAGKDDFNVAHELAAIGYKTTVSMNDAELRHKANVMRERTEQFRNWQAEAETAKKTLAMQPKDPTASAALGRYLCFVKENWEEGLPHLARSDDAKLKSAAELELGKPDRADKQAATGDAWWNLATPASGAAKLVYQKRAYHWYSQAVEGLKGLAKTTVEKRLATLAKAVSEAGGLSREAVAKQLVGDFYLTATAKRGGAKTNTTLAFAADGSVTDNQLPAGKWTVDGGQLNLAFEDASRGTVRLRMRDKDTLTGQQTLPKGELFEWDLKRVYIVSVWDVYAEPFSDGKPNRLVLYSNGKGNEVYGSTTWSLSGNQLSLDWKDFRFRDNTTTVRGTFTIEPGGKIFRGRDENRRFGKFSITLRGERVVQKQ